MRNSTVQRYILRLLREEHGHFTAKEVFQQLKALQPRLNPSTVYRALEQLTLAGEISVSDMGLGASVYEIVGAEPHHHMVCQQCHKILTIHNDKIQPFFDQMKGETGFELTTNHLVLFGYCPDCQKEIAENQ
jgi:Fur family ferric uptake transcriptional regulator